MLQRNTIFTARLYGVPRPCQPDTEEHLMSPQLRLSATISALVMALFVLTALSGTGVSPGEMESVWPGLPMRADIALP